MRKAIVLISIACVLVASALIVGYGAIQVQGSGRFAPTATPVPGVSVDVKATLPVGNTVDLSSVTSPRVLTWNPNKGQLVWINASTSAKIADGFGPKALVIPCALAPSADRLVVFLGGEKSTEVMYPLDSGPTAPLGDTVGLSCSVPHRTQFSPDGQRVGLIQYDNKATAGEYAVGKLRILKSPEATQLYTADSVVSFDLQNDGVLALQFFANTKGDATGAVLLWWDGQKERTLESDIKPLDNCTFVAGRAIRVADKVYTLFGETCKQPTGSKWRLMSTNLAGGGSANILSGPTTGKYFPSVNTNDLWLLPTGKDLLISVPEGLSNESANIARISLADGSISNVLPRVITDTYPPNPTWIGKRFAFSPKGDKLALTTRDNNGGEQLYIYDVTNPGSAPVSIAGGDKIDRINGVVWAADGSGLFYIMAGQTNALGYYAVSGDKKLLARTNGQFISMGINPDGSAVAMTEMVVPNKSNPGDVRYNLILFTVADQGKVTLVEGGKGEAPLAPFWLR